MATVNIHQVDFRHVSNNKDLPNAETAMVAAAVPTPGQPATNLASLIKSNYKGGTGPAVNVNAAPIAYHNVLTTGATGIVSLYKVGWHSSRHNGANTQIVDTFVLGATNGASLASTIQTANGDGLTVTIDRVETVLPVVFA